MYQELLAAPTVLMELSMAAFMIIPLLALVYLVVVAVYHADHTLSSKLDVLLWIVLLIVWSAACYCATYGIFIWPYQRLS